MTDYFISKISKNLLIWIIIQLPICVYQFQTMDVRDYIGGSFGYGGSGMLTSLLFIIVYYLFVSEVKNISDMSNMYKKKMWLFLFLTPVFLNETKISFFLLPIFFVFLIDLKKHFIKSVVFLLIGFLIFNIYSSTYTEIENKTSSEVLNTNYFYQHLVLDLR